MVEAVLVRRRLVELLIGQPQVPFANVGRCVSGLLQHFCQCHFAQQEMRMLAGIMNPTVDARTYVMTTGHQNGT